MISPAPVAPPRPAQSEVVAPRRVRLLTPEEAGFARSLEEDRRRIREMSALRYHLGRMLSLAAGVLDQMAHRLHK